MNFAILDSLVTAAMRTQYAQSFHLAFGTEFAKYAVHAAFDVMDGAVFEVFDQWLVTRE